MYTYTRMKIIKKYKEQFFFTFYVRTTFDIQMSPNTIINKTKTLSYKQLHIIKYAFQKCKTNDIIFDVWCLQI